MNPTLLQIPVFVPKYDKHIHYGYKNMNGENLINLLYEITGGYCMYCYSKIEVDSKRYGHLEHSIEKRHSSKLEECVPNIGVACPKCNLSFKKIGDTGEVFTKKQIKNYESAICRGEQCKKECSAYKRLKRLYLKKRKIILQPMGITSKGHTYKLQYNLLKLSFEPSILENYSDEEKQFIQEHILKFNLNDATYRTREILRCCEDVINGDTYLRKGKYSNLVVDLFIDNLKQVQKEKRLKLCETIYMIGKKQHII